MKICAVSDLHGFLPKIPKCDVLVIAGDICPLDSHRDVLGQSYWLRDVFTEWLNSIDAKHKNIVWGNHDWVADKSPHLISDLPCNILQDSGIAIDGVNFWGSPWQLRFHNWAFNLDEPDLAKKYERIPDNINVLITHGPPLGYGDKTSMSENVGSRSLTKTIINKKINLTVTGHIHPAYGKYEINNEFTVLNASCVNEKYKPTNKMYLVELDEHGKVLEINQV